MDYYSITTSDVEWRAAICLCGMRSCRGSFLSYATQDDLQQVLNQNCGPLWRYASLLRACGGRALTEVDQATLDRHGMKVAALGPNPPSWLLKYAADNLNFVEFERKALPCALMRPRNGSVTGYTFSAADMDARCVMEQRLQSMVCGFSMVQRVLARQEHQQQHEEHADKHAEGKAKKAKSEMLPVKALTAGDAAERVWKYMSDIPELLEEYVLARLQQHNKAAALGEAGGDLDDFSDGLVTENNSGTAKNSTGNGNSNSKSKKSSAVDSEEKKRQMVEKIAERLADEQKVEETIAEIKGILANKPVGLTGLREGCLALHRAIKNIANLSWSKARLGLLADVLVLWAHTSNYSCIQEYSKVESEPLHVPARELGTNIPRAKIFKPEVGSRRKAAAPSTSAKSIASTSSKSSDDETSVDKDEEGTTNMNVVIQENGVENEKGDQIADISFETEASATTSTNDQSGALTASTVVELDVTHTTTSTAAETAVTVAEASPSSLATDREVMSVSASSEKSIPNDIDKDSTAVVKSKVEDSNSGSGDKAPVIQMETEEATEADDSQPSSIEAAVAGSTSLLAQACTSSETSTTAGEMEKTTANTGSGRTAKYNFPFAAIMEPNEPVYTGSKVYEKLFVFWQVKYSIVQYSIVLMIKAYVCVSYCYLKYSLNDFSLCFLPFYTLFSSWVGIMLAPTTKSVPRICSDVFNYHGRLHASVLPSCSTVPNSAMR